MQIFANIFLHFRVKGPGPDGICRNGFPYTFNTFRWSRLCSFPVKLELLAKILCKILKRPFLQCHHLYLLGQSRDIFCILTVQVQRMFSDFYANSNRCLRQSTARIRIKKLETNLIISRYRHNHILGQIWLTLPGNV
jgi:hypothetical protein